VLGFLTRFVVGSSGTTGCLGSRERLWWVFIVTIVDDGVDDGVVIDGAVSDKFLFSGAWAKVVSPVPLDTEVDSPVITSDDAI